MWREVPVEEFVQAEKFAGFHNLGGGPTATAGFGGRGMLGRVTNDDADLKPPIYDVAYIQIKAAMQCLESAETGWDPLDELTAEAFNILDDAQAMVKPMIKETGESDA